MFSSYYLTKGACKERLKLKHERKLKVLCLHGYNTDANVMEYQMRHFRAVFHEVMEFTIVNAPFDCEDAPPRELQKKFFPEQPSAKFKSWLKFHSWLPTEEKKYESPDVVFGHEECVDYLVDIMRSEGPFDGVLCFSQGGIIFRHFHRITQEIDPQAFALPGASDDRQTFHMPKFMISVASPVFPKMRFRYKNDEYAQRLT